MSSAHLLDRKVLHLGSGKKYRADAVNVDSREEVHPDIVLDLDKRPWPFADSAFREVHAYDVLEHLSDVVGTLEEIHRVCENGAIVKLTVPHFSCANAFTDPTHRHYFGHQSFHYLTGEHEHDHYTSVRFRRRVTQIVFEQSPLNRLVRRLANARPSAYEKRWAWMFPAWFLYAELEVVKDAPART